MALEVHKTPHKVVIISEKKRGECLCQKERAAWRPSEWKQCRSSVHAEESFRTLEGCELEAEVHEKLGEYKSFVREVEGEEPTDGAICSAALEMLFAADTAFAKSQETKRKIVRYGSAANGDGATSHAAARAGNDKAKKDTIAAS